MDWVGFNPICAAVDEGNDVSEWRIVDGRRWFYTIHVNEDETGNGYIDLTCWRMYKAGDFYLLASEAIVAPFFDNGLGIWPREAGKDHP